MRTQGRSVLYVCTNLKLIAVVVQKLLWGHHMSKLGHATLSHAPFEPLTLNLCRNLSTHKLSAIFYSSILIH